MQHLPHKINLIPHTITPLIHRLLSKHTRSKKPHNNHKHRICSQRHGYKVFFFPAQEPADALRGVGHSERGEEGKEGEFEDWEDEFSGCEVDIWIGPVVGEDLESITISKAKRGLKEI